MNIDCTIRAFLVEGTLFQPPTDDVSTWHDIEKLYTVVETIDIPDNLVEKIIEAQKICRGPHVYFKFMTDGFKWSQLERINHKKEVEHREAYRARLIASGEFTESQIDDYTGRFHVMVYPSSRVMGSL